MADQPASPPAATLDDRPRLRPLEAFPSMENGQPVLILRDPSGLASTAKVPPIAAAVIQLCDGETTRDQICAEFHRRYNQRIDRASLDKLLQQLDDVLLLDSEKFRHHSAKIFSEFSRAEVRPAFHAGKSYPQDPLELHAFLKKCFDPPHGPGEPTPVSRPLPKAIIAPHIDFHRGGPAYAWAYKPLAEAQLAPELIVLLGTDHAGADHVFTLTRKHYETPLGRLTTDVALVDRLRAEAGAEAGAMLFADEHHHRGEHSLELSAVWIRHALGERAEQVKILPVLCGSMNRFVAGKDDPARDAEVAGFLHSLVAAVAGRRVLWIAAADLAHVGPRFGDAEALGPKQHEELQAADQNTLKRAAAGDAAGWFAELKKEGDRRRVCGLTPIYAMLTAAQPGRGKLEAYGQCPAEEGSIVSIASLVYG